MMHSTIIPAGPIRNSLWAAILILTIIQTRTPTRAATANELSTAYESLKEPEFGDGAFYAIQGAVVTRKDFELRLDSGIICFLDPVILSGDSLTCCAYFQGRGSISFTPTPAMERGQLERFLDDDSLICSIDDAALYFEPETYREILLAIPQLPGYPKRGSADEFDRLHDQVIKNTYQDRTANFLRSLAGQSGDRFLMVSTELTGNKRGRVLFVYDPYEREEVQFYKRYKEIVDEFMEDVCIYSAEAGPNQERINGRNKDEIAVRHYVTEASIGNWAEFRATLQVTFDALHSGAQVLTFDLGPTIELDSVTDSTGGKVAFACMAIDDDNLGDATVFLNRPLVADESATLTFHCGGKIATLLAFEFLVPVSSDWYPSYGWSQPSTFDMKFRVPERLVLVAMGEQVDRQERNDSLYLHYVVTKPARHCTFSIGTFSRYEFRVDKAPKVDVYYSKDLHLNAANLLGEMMIPTGRHMEKQVAGDVIGAAQLFSHQFGPYPDSILTITEILSTHGLAYPGFIQFAAATWINTDAWGEDRIFRAHETAHQWWGCGVTPETYHDTWLSEAFAEYSALMYLQAVAGNDQFLSKLDAYRDELFGVRKPMFGSRDETGTISLGYRNSTTKTAGDYDLVIYRKGAFVLHMLRNMLIDLQTMKENRFFTLMKDWYATYRDSTVTTEDFRRHCEKHIGVDMGWFFRQWIDGNDLPTYELTYELEQNEKQYWVAHCRISQADVPEDFVMYMPLDIDFGQGRHYYHRAQIDKPTVDFDLPAFDLKPNKIKLNPFHSVLCRTKD